MIPPDDLLRTIVEALRRPSGADRAALYLPSSSIPAREPLLVSAGQGPAIPELADPASAARLEREHLAAAGDGADSAGNGGDPDSPWVSLPSSADDVILLRLPPLERLVELLGRSAAAVDRRVAAPEERLELWRGSATWLGLRFPAGGAELAAIREALARPCGNGGDAAAPHALPWLFTLIGSLAGQARLLLELLHDPTSRLLGRTELQRLLGEALRHARLGGGTVALLLVNPDDFAGVNDGFGREAGDAVVRQIADRLVAGVRKTDVVGRYGGVVFAVLLGGVRAREALGVARKLAAALGDRPYAPRGIRLGFSIGVVEWDPQTASGEVETALELLLRADRALSAARNGERDKIALWDEDLDADGGEPVDRLQGIFTGDVARDYRNMLILWDTVAATTSSTSFAELAERICRRLTSALHIDRLAVLAWDEGGPLRVVAQAARAQAGAAETAAPSAPPLAPEALRLVEEAMRRQAVEQGEVPAPGLPKPHVGLALPLVSGAICTGAAYLERRGDRSGPDLSDSVFLQALAAQMATAQERDRLIEEAARLRERDRQQVRAELAQLKPALGSDQLVYRSRAMAEVLATARKVADSDATVLVDGESGTGKELLARTLHAMSGRREAPLVVVDCTTLTPSLLESELFGHERGAFTGADRAATGRLGEAEGGTLVLDEIGELPAEAQGRLLRLVQERAYTPVGSSRPRQLDARLVAVTNRDLPAEVAAGRFREDLFYRLNVVRLTLPPLRRRPEDVELLAEHFLERLAQQNGRPVVRLGKDARGALLAHRWPGNVRELQNRIVRAVLLARGPAVAAQDLGLEDDGRSPAGNELEGAVGAGTAVDPWAALAIELGRQVGDHLADEDARPAPLGRWLGDDLVVAADRRARGTRTEGAALLGLPETTYRRRLEKALAARQGGLAGRAESWQRTAPLIERVVAAGAGPTDSLTRARDLLLAEVVARVPEGARTGAALMGVTAPTFSKWAARLAGERRRGSLPAVRGSRSTP